MRYIWEMVPVINNPCPEKWDEMTPESQGRFCGKCAKLVVDFTRKTTQEIIDFLNARKGEDICGKLKRPELIPVQVKSGTKLFTAALYLVFGSLLFSSCGNSESNEEPVGKVSLDSATEANNQRYLDSMNKADSAYRANQPKDSSVIDSATMMNTMNVLDSIMKSKNK